MVRRPRCVGARVRGDHTVRERSRPRADSPPARRTRAWLVHPSHPMAASNTSGPDEPGELSAREKKILEGIEDDMLTADPTLAHQMTGRPGPSPGPDGGQPPDTAHS